MFARAVLCSCAQKCVKHCHTGGGRDRSNCLAQGANRRAEPSRWLWQPEHLAPWRAPSGLGQDGGDALGGISLRFSHSFAPGGESAELIGLKQLRTWRLQAREREP